MSAINDLNLNLSQSQTSKLIGVGCSAFSVYSSEVTHTLGNTDIAMDNFKTIDSGLLGIVSAFRDKSGKLVETSFPISKSFN